jgi:hypothetical protein
MKQNNENLYELFKKGGKREKERVTEGMNLI